MHVLVLGLLLILAGGMVPLLCIHRLHAARPLHVALLAAGSLCGLAGLFSIWRGAAAATYSCTWQTFTLTLATDSLSAAFLLPIFLLAPLIALYGHHYLNAAVHPVRTAISGLMLSLLIVAMALVVLADNMITFVLAWELMSLASFALVLYDWDQQPTRKAAYIYLLFTQTGALCLFATFGLLYSASGSVDFDSLAALPHGIKLTAFLLALLCFGSKAGVMPVHVWLPHAHPAAPSHVSALMSGVMIKMGVYGLLRLYFLLDDPSLIFARIVLGLGMLSGVLGIAYALGKNDLKRLLAYSSIENVGIILIGCGLGMMGLAMDLPLMAVFGFAGAILHVLNHSLFKSLLFMGAGAVLNATGTRNIDALGGLMRRMPVTGRSFLVGSTAISGLPPLNGFVGEFCIYYAGFLGLRIPGAEALWPVGAILSLALIGGLASACFTKVVGIVFLGEPRTEQAQSAVEPGRSMRAAMLVIAALCLLIGFFPAPFLIGACAALRDLAPFANMVPTELLGPIPRNLTLASWLFFAVVAVLVVLRRRLYRGKPIQTGATWGCGFTQPNSRIQYTGASYALSIVSFFRPSVQLRTQYSGISKIFPGETEYGGLIRDVAEIGLERWLVAPVLRLSEKLRWIQHGRIQLYIAYIVLTIILLLLTV
ncbi:MAG: proton-conducting transporter membrane subunit [Desulfobulbus sp.]|jgi:hydrogenase-4 component B